MFCTGSNTSVGFIVPVTLEEFFGGNVASIGSPSRSIVGTVTVASIDSLLLFTPGSSTSLLTVASGSGWGASGRGGMSTSPSGSCSSSPSRGTSDVSSFISIVFCSLDSLASTNSVVSSSGVGGVT